MTEVVSNEAKQEAQGIIPFVTEVARYFMDFLETDFHKIRGPKRHIQNRNSKDLQVTINLNKYKKYAALVWKVVRAGFEDDALNELSRGAHITAIPQSLLKLIEGQIAALTAKDTESLIKLFKNEIDVGLTKNPNDSVAAISYAMDGIARVIQEKFLSIFMARIQEPLDKLQVSTGDSIYQIETELTEILSAPFEDAVSFIINQISLDAAVDAESLLAQVFELKDIQSKLESYFKGFAAGDLFFEVAELMNNKQLMDKQELYLYFGDITYKNYTCPLFYIPVQIEKTHTGFSFNFDTLLYVNKKAIQYVAQDFNANMERQGTLNAFAERIIYLAEKREHLISEIDLGLKEAITYFGLNPYIDINNPERQAAKGKDIQISNSCYLGLFDKADESLVNDYEEILLRLKNVADPLAGAFKVLIDDFITNNPESIVSAVEHEWDGCGADEKLVYGSPVPLNEEQRQILSALKKSKCKYLTIEGPPGTGKSHTITAIACDAILQNQSVLILSDKKEALDVVEDKITETMNKVRLDQNFQNPILRLGQTGNTYSKILSTASIERIKEHYKAVKNDYKKLEHGIDQSITDLKGQIKETINAYEQTQLADIAEFTKLETEIQTAKDLPVALDELNGSATAVADLTNLRSQMLALRTNIAGDDKKLLNLFSNYFSKPDITSFKNFLTFLEIIDEVKTTYNQSHLADIKAISTDGLSALQRFINQCQAQKNKFLGYLLNGKKLVGYNQELSAQIDHNILEPHQHLDDLQNVVRLFHKAEQLKRGYEISNHFKFEKDFIDSVHQLLVLGIELPNVNECKNLFNVFVNIKTLLTQYPQTAQVLALDNQDITTYYDNPLTAYAETGLEKLAKFLTLKQTLQAQFDAVPRYSYSDNKKAIEELVTTQMTYKMDERVIDFQQNHRSDAKALVSVISKKQRFDKKSFEKLKNSFPCILAGIRDFAEYIPLEEEIFDLVIIDEASQVSIAQAFPALLRGKKIVVLGDRKQFSNVKAAQARSDTNREYLNRLREVFCETLSTEAIQLEKLGKFDIKTSILDFFERISNYNIMLKKHFRGYRENISYSSKYFYDDNLQAIKIRAKPIEDVIRFEFVEHDSRKELIENSNQLEIDAIVAEVERMVEAEPYHSLAIITPHTNQQKMLVDRFAKHSLNEHLQTHHKLKIFTFDTCQGEERDVILYSMVANPASDKLWGVFIKDRKDVDLEEGGKIKLQRLNVGFSRAKERMHFFLSKPLDQFNGSIGEALDHYHRTHEMAKQLPTAKDTDARSPMEKKVLNWLQETSFFKENRDAIELQAQFPLGEYIKQLDKRYSHPAFVADFLLLFTDENGQQKKIIIEYDGFEYHFQNHEAVNEFSYGQYYTEGHVYREKVLESYGYNFLRINRFNIGKDPIETLSQRLAEITKKKPKIAMH